MDQPRKSFVVEGENISLDTTTLDTIISDKENFLGSGSYADVYKYVCPESRKSIALKRLKNSITKKGKPIATKLMTEINVHRDLDHNNILKFFGHIEDSSLGVFLVIQYAERGSLTDFMEKKELDRNRILIYIEQILQGLSYLHNYTNKHGEKQPIAHRDLRCHNVLMMADGTLKIADFGLCKRLLEMAEASGISSKRGNPFWVGPELVDKTRRKDLPAKTLVLTDIWSLGVLILELYYYSAGRVPFIHFYTYEEYIYKLGDGWGPKIPDNAPQEIKKLLGYCFEFVIDKRTSADNLLQQIRQIDSQRKANLMLTEPIRDLEGVMSTSDSHDTLTSRDTATTTETPKTAYTMNGLEVDPLSQYSMDDTEYLTKLHHPTIVTQVPPTPRWSADQQNNIIRAITQEELNRYVAKENEELILEDSPAHDRKYHVKRKDNSKVVFLVYLRENGKKLSLKQPQRARQRSQTIFSVDSSNKRYRCVSASAGGIFAHVHEPGLLKKVVSTGNLRLEVNSAGEMGAKALDFMSPRTRRRIHSEHSTQLPTSSSDNTLDSFHTARQSLSSNCDQESLTGSSSKLTFNDRNLDVQKNNPEVGGFKYTIRYREDKVEIGYFNTSMETGTCEILVTPDSNTALVTTIVAYYYQQKLKKQNRFSWPTKLSLRSGSSKYKNWERTSHTP